jgi:hypothetical protein
MRGRPMRFLLSKGTRAPLGLTRNTLRVVFSVAALSMLAAAVPGSAAADDTTPPNITYTIDGIAGANKWYRGSSHGNFVVVRWMVSDPESQITSATCLLYDQVAGPNIGTTRSCSATSDGGTTTITTKLIKIDADPPTGISASASRGPDFNGWYNHPVGVAWRGSDATSGIAACTSSGYGGPDRAAVRIGGGCTDRAGNTTSAPVTLNYDATAPVMSKVSVTSEKTADVVHWNSSSPSDTVAVERWARGNKEHPTVYRGIGKQFADRKVKKGLEYMYAVQALDQAGNASKRISAAGLPKVLTLRKMAYVPRAAKKPILSWNAVRGASYYHVQLFRGSKRILAAWPANHQLGLPGKWRWAGHRYRLRPGHYRWYVWAGLGRRAFANYKALGSARFIVPR